MSTTTTGKAESEVTDPEKFSGLSNGGDSGSEDESSDDDDLSQEMIRRMVQMRLQGPEKKEKPKVLTQLSIDGIVNHIESGKATKIVTMAGAGISTSAGIPDFRSPGTGLYANLQKYNLPDPHAIFEIGYFRKNPEPFFKLAKELYPNEDKFKPTPSHHFIKLLHDKGLLLRHYTQNIDCLERLTGLPEEKLIEAHGTFHSAHCIDASCKTNHSQEWVKDKLFKYDVIPTCDKCNSVVKPDIVFFGENLPKKFHDNAATDFHECDLLIVMGTSLTVQPFARLVDRVSFSCPRVLFNREKCGMSCGFDFHSEEAYRDVAVLGTTDDSCLKLAQLLGWQDDLQKLINPERIPEGSGSDKAQL